MTAQSRPRLSGGLDPSPTSSVFLERVSGELQILAAIVADMQEGLSPILSDPAADRPETVRHAQNIDLVWQTLTGLAEVMALAARDSRGCGSFDIEAVVAGLPLAAVASRLRGLGSAETDNDLDLF